MSVERFPDCKILKFQLEIDEGWQKIEMPINAQAISVGFQAGSPDKLALWAVVRSTTTETELREFRVLGTGWGAMRGDLGNFLGTVLTYNGSYVWHVFEKYERRTL